MVAAVVAAGVTVSVEPSVASAASCPTVPLGLTWDSSLAGGLILDLSVRSAPATIDWGDGTTPTSLSAAPTAASSHTYATAGTYSISVCGVTRFGNAPALWNNRGVSGFTAVTSFASGMTDLECAFEGWSNLVDVPASLPSTVTTLQSAFYQATKFNDPDIASWNTANVTTLGSTFFEAKAFNQPIGSWNVGNVTTMRNTFYNAQSFNQPLGTWNVSKVWDFVATFRSAKVFDQDLGAWNTSSATTMEAMFSEASAFNNGGSDSIKNWNTALNTTLYNTFVGAFAFNQPIGSWNTARVTTMKQTFSAAYAFNQPLDTWNTSAVTDMSYTFANAKVFNQPLATWNTAKVTTMAGMFMGTEAFNQPIGNWNTALVSDMSSMFQGALVFDQDISTWSPASLTYLKGATTMWDTTQSVMSIANYDKLLIAWSNAVLKFSVKLGFGKHKYSCAAVAARAKITSSPNNWQVTDGGLDESVPVISTIVPGDGKLSVYFNSPTCISPQRVTYQYSLDGGTTWLDLASPSLSSPIVITGLTNGTEYPISIRAKGGSGTSYYGPPSATVNGTPFGSATIKAKNETSVYGAAVPTVGYTSTLATGDWVGTVTCKAYTSIAYTTEITSSTKPGTYVTRCTGSTTTGLGSPLTYTNGTYTVTKAPLTITAKSFTKTYGDTVTTSGSTDFTASGLIGSDAVSSVTLTTSGKPASAGVAGSPYPVVPSAAVGAASKILTEWYTITYANGTIVVNKAPSLSVTATTYTIDEGDTGPASIGFDVSGFVNSETFATAGYTAPTCGVYDGVTLKSPPYSSLPAGNYTVKCSGGVAGNYAGITYSESKFVVKAANVNVAGKAASGAYGTTPVVDTGYEVVGDLNGASVVCKAYTDDTYTEEVTSSTRPGKYLTHCTGPANNGSPDYTPIVYVDGEYTVDRAPLTITVESHSKTYGDVITLDDDLSDGSSDVTVVGLVNGDAVLSVVLTTSGDVGTAGVSGSPYSIVASGAAMDCECDITDFYDITYVDGTITVAKKTLTIAAKDLTLQVGSAVPTSYEFTATGWENGENDTTNLPDGWVAPTCTSSFNSTTPLGTPVDITCSGGSADDYDFTFDSGSVSIGNPVVTVENTTQPAYETSGATANVSLKATITNWAPGCKVTFTLSPSVGTASPYTVYTTGSNDVSVAAQLPVGVYDIVTSVSEGCEGDADTTGIVAVVPNGPGGAAHTDTYGTRYRDSATGKTVVLNMEWLRKLVRTKNPVTGVYESSYVTDSYYNWSIYGSNQWRIASKPFSGTVTLTDGGSQSTTVSTWGRMDCPEGMYPVGNVSVCSAVTNIVMLQQWVPNPANPKYGTWSDVGEVLIVEKLAEGLWPYRCATLACKTPLPDYVAFQMRPVPGDSTPTPIPAGLPAFTDWSRVIYSEVLHKQV